MALRRHRLFSKRILHKEHEEAFFLQVEVGKTYQYNYGNYVFNDVKRAAETYGIEIAYNKTSTDEHIIYGSFNFTVISISQKPTICSEPQLFDTNELMI